MDETARVAALTDAEREALRAFLRQSSIKEIARAIGKSPHTVEQRLARARRRLGVARSMDAAHMLARVEGRTYGTAVYPPSDVAAGEDDEDKLVAVEKVDARNWSSPFPTKGRPWNAASPWMRLSWIALGVLVIVISTLLMAAAIETVSRIVRQHF